MQNEQVVTSESPVHNEQSDGPDPTSTTYKQLPETQLTGGRDPTMLHNDMEDSELMQEVSATGKKSQKTTRSDDQERKDKSKFS